MVALLVWKGGLFSAVHMVASVKKHEFYALHMAWMSSSAVLVCSVCDWLDSSLRMTS